MPRWSSLLGKRWKHIKVFGKQDVPMLGAQGPSWDEAGDDCRRTLAPSSGSLSRHAKSLECVLQPMGRAERREKVHLTWQVQDSWGGWVRAQGPQLGCPGEILRGGSLGATEERPETGKDMYPVGEGGRSWVPCGSSCWALAGHVSSRCRPDLLTQHVQVECGCSVAIW